MPDAQLDGVVAIVTGAAGGLGLAMTDALLEAGACVTAVDVGREGREKLASSISGRGDRILPLTVDIREGENCEKIVERTIAEFGRVDGLVNNAGIGLSTIRANYYVNPIRFWQVPDSRWRAVMETNAMAPFMMAKAVVPHLLEAEWGRIVNVTTSLDTMIRPAWTPYGPSKAALEAMSSNWAGDVEGSGVTVNVLVPGGPANTGMVPSESSPDRDAMIQPEVMKKPVCWLMSRESDGFNGRRIAAISWDSTLSGLAAADKASAPVAWTGLGQQAVWPGA